VDFCVQGGKITEVGGVLKIYKRTEKKTGKKEKF
jgi:hypothetical protein